MKFPVGCKIAECCGDPSRGYSFDHVMLVHEGERAPGLFATDGRKLAYIPLELEEGEVLPTFKPGSTVLIPQEAIAAAGKLPSFSRAIGEFVRLTLTDKQITVQGGKGGVQTFDLVLDKDFARVEAVIPRTMSNPRAFAFNVDYLLDLSRALARKGPFSSTIVLVYDQDNKAAPYAVHAGQGTMSVFQEDKLQESFGVLMPITEESDYADRYRKQPPPEPAAAEPEATPKKPSKAPRRKRSEPEQAAESSPVTETEQPARIAG